MTPSARDALKAAAYTALWTFLAIFLTAVLGWLTALTEWATSDGGAVVFPDPAVLVKAMVAAVAAALAFVVAAVVRLAQAAGAPGQPPSYDRETPADDWQQDAWERYGAAVTAGGSGSSDYRP